MSERTVIALASGWALGANSKQWLLYRVSADGRVWPIHFIATHKRIIDRLVREEGIALTQHGRELIDALPDYFKHRKCPRPMRWNAARGQGDGDIDSEYISRF
jgi:hypothetical protein